MIVVHHAANVSGPQRTAPFTEVAWVADVGVAVFFVLSGFVIYRPFAAAHLSGRSVPATVPFWWRRALRLLPAYWFALFGLWALGLNTFNSVGEMLSQATLTHVFGPGLAFQGISQSWSLSVELSFYAVVPLISWVVRRRRVSGGAVSDRREWGMVGALFLTGYLVSSFCRSARFPGATPPCVACRFFGCQPTSTCSPSAWRLPCSTPATWSAQASPNTCDPESRRPLGASSGPRALLGRGGWRRRHSWCCTPMRSAPPTSTWATPAGSGSAASWSTG